MKSFEDYIEASCSGLEDNHMSYLYKRKILEDMKKREFELICTGLVDNNVIRDLIADELGDLKTGYKNFLADEKKKKRANMMKIGFPVGGFAALILILISYFTVSDLTGAWNKSWLIIVGGIFAMIVFYLIFAIRKLCTMRRIFHPIARAIIVCCVMLVTVFAFLCSLMMIPSIASWPMLPGGVILALIADLIFAFATKQKFRTISLMVYMPVIATMSYIMLAAYGVVTWSSGWPVILLGVAADIMFVAGAIIGNMKYFMYRQEDVEQ